MHKLGKAFLFIWKTLRVKLPTEMHKGAWRKFEEYVYVRNILVMLLVSVLELTRYIAGTGNL